MAATKRSATDDAFSAEERAAMKEHVSEHRAAKRKGADADGEQDVLAKIASMDEEDRVLAERVHAIVKRVAPDLVPRTWYGSPAYAKDGKVVCFFQERSKFKVRYATLGFSDRAQVDEGSMWPTSYALTALTEEIEQRVADLVRRAAA